MEKRHTDREYENELKLLRERLVLMAARVEEMIANAMRALEERNIALAKATIEADHDVNRAEVETDELCLIILAKRQPLAKDLRFITLALKMVTDLERIGDIAVNICERALTLNSVPQLCPYDDVLRMGVIVQSNVREAIDAFVAGDAEKAQEIIERDDPVDDLYRVVIHNIFDQMHEDPEALERGIHIQSVAKFLERIGDHCTNLAEQVVFMVKGKDIRHMGHRKPESGAPPRDTFSPPSGV